MSDADPPILEIVDYDGSCRLVTIAEACRYRESDYDDDPAITREKLLAGENVLTVAGTYRLATADEAARIEADPTKPWRMAVKGPIRPSDRHTCYELVAT